MADLEFEVRGDKEIAEKIRQLPSKIMRGTEEAMAKATLLVSTEAIKSMRPGTGRKYKRGSIIHVASAPGFPPAVDTGRLRASIGAGTKTVGSEIVGTVGSNMVYAPPLEFGSSRMAARPFLQPAIEKCRRGIERLLDGVITKVVTEANR